ncbi:MAG: hypothetical protein KF792_11075 [Chelatococcus sp.]|nr:hypothetical protein [Chelatococcus sp. YT9]MBX3556789.1 hypothetical protein [Chelatococcus sp.]
MANALVSGTAVGIATTAVLALLARIEGRDAVEPVNSTSHWYHGETAGSVRRLDTSHTLLGFVTHHSASVFWASIFQLWRRFRPGRPALIDAAGVSALAALVDYGIVPKRLTPGWEKVVSPTSIILAYGVMALALVATSPAQAQENDEP